MGEGEEDRQRTDRWKEQERQMGRSGGRWRQEPEREGRQGGEQ